MLEGGAVWEGAVLTGTLEGLGAECWPGAPSWQEPWENEGSDAGKVFNPGSDAGGCSRGGSCG